MVVFGGGQIQFLEDAAHVFLDGALADPDGVGDAGVRPTFGHQRENLALSRCELGKWIVVPSLND